MLKYTLGTNKLRYFGNLGGYLGFLTKARNVLVGYEGQSKDDGLITEGNQNIDFGISGGLGLQYALNNRISLELEIRNNLGLYNISKLPIHNDGTNKLNSTNLLIGVNYGFGE